MRMESDLLEAMEASIDAAPATGDFKWSGDAAVCVVMASGGYPGSYEVGKKIGGTRLCCEARRSESLSRWDVEAGWAYYTAGGRVLAYGAGRRIADSG